MPARPQLCRCLATAVGGGLRRDLNYNAIGGTLPASLSALINLVALCAARSLSLRRGFSAPRRTRTTFGAGARQRMAAARPQRYFGLAIYAIFGAGRFVWGLSNAFTFASACVRAHAGVCLRARG
jgi:hypothetical protein